MSKRSASANTIEGGVRVTCHRCGKPGHLATLCRFCDSVCHRCEKKGHLAKVCRNKTQVQPTPQARLRTRRTTSNSQPVRRMDEESDTDSDDSMQPTMTIKQRQDGRTPPIKVHVEVDKVSIPMGVDTGASVSIMSENQYHKLWPGRSLYTSAIRLQTYSKDPITARMYRQVGALALPPCFLSNNNIIVWHDLCPSRGWAQYMTI